MAHRNDDAMRASEMKPVQLQIASGSDLLSIARLYRHAFPLRERMPFWMLRGKMRHGRGEILRLGGEAFAGFAISWFYADIVLLAYFAICPGCRGGGLGSRALALLRRRYAGKRIAVEIEMPQADAPNQAQRLRRKAFYLRNGFTQTPLRVCLFGVPMELLRCGDPVSFAEYRAIYAHLLGTARADRLIECMD